MTVKLICLMIIFEVSFVLRRLGKGLLEYNNFNWKLRSPQIKCIGFFWRFILVQVPVVLEAVEVWAVHSLVTPKPKMKLEYDSAQSGMQCQWFRCFSSGLVHPLPCKHSTKWQTPLQSRAEPGNNHGRDLLVHNSYAELCELITELIPVLSSTFIAVL